MSTEFVRVSMPMPPSVPDKPVVHKPRKVYSVGSKVNSLTLKELAPDSKRPDGRVYRNGLFICDCGNTKIIRLTRVFRGETKACGCNIGKVLTQSQTTHGLTQTREFHIWNNMRYRCNSVGSKDYQKYGARGITVCARWDSSFENFLTDMGVAPSVKHTLDRIDNYKGYDLSNCRWATAETQMNNRRDTKKLVVDGLLLSRAQLARHARLKESDVYNWFKVNDFTPERFQALVERKVRL